MLTHNVTLTQLARWLKEQLTGASVYEVFSQTRNELIMTFRLQEQFKALRISVDPKNNFIFLLNNFSRAKRNSIDLFDLLPDRTVLDITAAPCDRILFIHCSNLITVAIPMYGNKANVLTLDDHNSIIEAFVHAKDLNGMSFSWQADAKADKTQIDSLEIFSKILITHEHTTLGQVLKSMFPVLGKILNAEILYQAKLDSALPVSSLTDDQKHLLFQQITELFQRLKKLQPIIYYENNVPVKFSMIPLSQLSHLRQVGFDSINEALRVYVSESMREEHFEEERKKIERQLHTEIIRNKKTIDKIRSDLESSDRAAMYEHYGTLLMTFGDSPGKDRENLEVNDPVTGDPVTIPIDKRLTSIQNAGKYFERAKKAKSARRESQTRLKNLEKTLSELDYLEQKITECKDNKDIKNFFLNHKKQLQEFNMVKNDKKDASAPFRIFHVVGGFEVWAGKSSKNNDELTLRYAKPDDLWFHARGSSGSHVVLRTGTGNGEPSKEAKIQAAAIAAYYSKQRNAKYVPVAMTEKKYVRKPRGASAGTVAIEREKVLMVTPALPRKDESEL